MKKLLCIIALGLSFNANSLAMSPEFKKEIFNALTPAQKIQVARHPQRPSTLDYIQMFCEDWVELHGDRNGTDDQALVGGLARIGEKSVLLIGQQKGRDTKENVARNFGMAKPGGYMDVISLKRNGFSALACLGTSATDYQIEQIINFYDKVFVVFDGDEAGKNATLRVFDKILTLLKLGKIFKFVFLPKNLDPEEFIDQEGGCVGSLYLRWLARAPRRSVLL